MSTIATAYVKSRTKAKSKRLLLLTTKNQIQILSKILDMSKIRLIVYRPGIHNLQTRIVSFPDQKKLLEKIGG